MVLLTAYIIPFRVSEITLFDQDQIIIVSWFDLLPIFSRLRSPKNNSTDPLIPPVTQANLSLFLPEWLLKQIVILSYSQTKLLSW